MRFRFLLLLALCLVPPAGWGKEPKTQDESEKLWSLLRAGGQVVMLRHALTTPGVGDPPGFRLEDCATQRNLSEEGRAEARRIGEALRAKGVPIGQVLSSPWCRCVETAKLAFGRAEVSKPLSNIFGRPENREPQVAALKPLVGAKPARGNLVMVSHGVTIAALTGVYLQMSEMVVLTPLGEGRFAVAGRLAPL